MSMIAMGSGAAARGLPVYLPPDEAAADANTFVCEFNGGSSANETGAGVLTGANLVLTQVGSIPGVSGGGRLLNGSSQYFTWTKAAADALLLGSEWSAVWKLDSMNGDKALCMFGAAITDNMGIWGLQALLTDSVSTRMRLLNGHSVVNEIFVAVWKKAGLVHCGWTDTTVTPGIPTGWDHFPFTQRACWSFGDFVTPFAATPHVFSSTYEYQACKAKQFWCSKLGLQAAPV